MRARGACGRAARQLLRGPGSEAAHSVSAAGQARGLLWGASGSGGLRPEGGCAAAAAVSWQCRGLAAQAAAEPRKAKAAAKAAPKAEDGEALSLVVSKALQEVTKADAGSFWVLSEEDTKRLLPEGCPALEREFQSSKSRRVLLRDAFFKLQQRILGDAGAAAADAKIVAPATLLMGHRGVGKSVLLGITAAWARAHGWLVLYVPQGRLLTERSQFTRNEQTGLWDTPDHARSLLASLSAAHGLLLQTLPRKMAGAPAGETLASLVAKGTAPSAAASVAVDAAVELLQELKLVTEVPVLSVVDEVNALSWWSEYHQVMGPKSRKRLLAGQLRVAAAVRDMCTPMARGAYLSATSESIGVSPRLRLEGVPSQSRRAVEGFGQADTEAMLRHYTVAGKMAAAESKEELAVKALRLRMVAGGDGGLIRSACVYVS